MDTFAILENSLWAAFFATGLGVLFTAPPRYLPAAFVCGFLGRGVRDLCITVDMNVNWATVISSTFVVLVALVFTRGRTVSPVVLICGVLPLGAAVPMFDLIFALMKVSSAKGAAAVDQASLAVSTNAGKVFATSLAIALGLAAGIAVQRVLQRKIAEDD